jgi:putative membrane protein
MRMTLHYALRSAINGGFAAYIIFLSRNDLLKYYIAPRMELYVKLVAVGLMMFAVYQAFAAFFRLRVAPLDCDCHHEPPKSFWRNAAAYSLLFTPLLLGYFLTDFSLGSALAAKKGVVLSASQTVFRGEAKAESVSPYAPLAAWLSKQNPVVIRDDIYLEASTAIDLFRENFVGKSIQIDGFVYREDGMPSDRFVVTRMTMDCCSADTTPYGFIVEADAAEALPEDSWVRVTGTIQTTEWDGEQVIAIEAGKAGILRIPAPSMPYIYPNFDILN